MTFPAVTPGCRRAVRDGAPFANSMSATTLYRTATVGTKINCDPQFSFSCMVTPPNPEPAGFCLSLQHCCLSRSWAHNGRWTPRPCHTEERMTMVQPRVGAHVGFLGRSSRTVTQVGGLRQHDFPLPPCRKPEVQNQGVGRKAHLLETQRATRSVPVPSPGTCWHFPTCGHIGPGSAFLAQMQNLLLVV